MSLILLVGSVLGALSEGLGAFALGNLGPEGLMAALILALVFGVVGLAAWGLGAGLIGALIGFIGGAGLSWGIDQLPSWPSDWVAGQLWGGLEE